MNPEVDKLDINKLVNVSTSLNNLKTKVDDLDIGKLKSFLVDLKKISDIIDKKVDKNTKFNTMKTKVNALEKNVPDGYSNLPNSTQSSEKISSEKNIGDVKKKKRKLQTLVV